MNNQIKDWRTDLYHWQQQNEKKIPDDQRQLREEFIEHFPIDDLKDMTLDQYTFGKPDSFCYWLESKTWKLGDIRGFSPAKFGVWWSKKEQRWRWNGDESKSKNKPYQDAEDALAQIKQGLLALIDATRNQPFDDLDKIGSKLLQRSSQRLSHLNTSRLKLWNDHPETYLVRYLRRKRKPHRFPCGAFFSVCSLLYVPGGSHGST